MLPRARQKHLVFGVVMERVGMFYGPLLTTMNHKRLDLHSQRLEESDCTDHVSHVPPQGTQSSSPPVVLRYRVFATKRAFSGLRCFLRLLPFAQKVLHF